MLTHAPRQAHVWLIFDVRQEGDDRVPICTESAFAALYDSLFLVVPSDTFVGIVSCCRRTYFGWRVSSSLLRVEALGTIGAGPCGRSDLVPSQKKNEERPD